MALSDADEEAAQLADRGAGGGRRLLRRTAALRATPTRASSRSRIADCPRRTPAPPAGRRPARSRGRAARGSRERGPARGRDRRPVPLAWPTPARCEATSICERASRSDPSAIAEGSHSCTVRITPRAIASANGLPFRDSSDSSEWVIASTPVAAVTSAGSRTVRLRVEDRRHGQQRGMADVVLPPDLLVRDHREGVRLGAGAGGRRDGDDRPAGDEIRAVVFEVPDRSIVGGAQIDRLGGVHRRAAADGHDDRPVEAARAGGQPRRVRPWRARDSARRRRRPSPGACRRRSPARRHPAACTPGSVTRKTREPPVAATTSDRRPTSPAPNSTRLRSVISMRRSARVDANLSPRPRGPGRRSCRAGSSASAGSHGVEPALGRLPSGFSKIQTSSKSRSSGSVIESGTSRRSPPNVNSSSGRRPQRGQVEPQHQRVPAEPWSARTWSRRNRSSENGAMSSGVAGRWRSARPSPRRRPGWP